MMNKKSMMKWTALLFGGATVFQSGCLNNFWDGFFNSGWPTDNRAWNIAIDVLKEELFG